MTAHKDLNISKNHRPPLESAAYVLSWLSGIVCWFPVLTCAALMCWRAFTDTHWIAFALGMCIFGVPSLAGLAAAIACRRNLATSLPTFLACMLTTTIWMVFILDIASTITELERPLGPGEKPKSVPSLEILAKCTAELVIIPTTIVVEVVSLAIFVLVTDVLERRQQRRDGTAKV